MGIYYTYRISGHAVGPPWSPMTPRETEADSEQAALRSAAEYYIQQTSGTSHGTPLDLNAATIEELPDTGGAMRSATHRMTFPERGIGFEVFKNIRP